MAWHNKYLNTINKRHVFLSGEAEPPHQRRPPAADLHQSLSAAGEGRPGQCARTDQSAGGRPAEPPPHRQK